MYACMKIRGASFDFPFIYSAFFSRPYDIFVSVFSGKRKEEACFIWKTFR